MDRRKHLCIAALAAMLCGIPLRAAAYSGVSISGTFQTNLTSISANEWQGIGYVPTNITSASLLFNGTGPAETLGDTNQPWSDLPAFATAEVTNNPITLGPANSGYFVFYFDEQTQAYGAQRCNQYVNFNNWSGVDNFGTNVVNSWMLSNARTTTNITETYAVYEGKSFILNDAGEQPFLMSPFIAAGIGEVSFWYRSREPDDDPKGAFEVEISTDAATWRSVASVKKAPSTYTHMRIPLADTTYRFVRIVGTTNMPRAQLCFDEISIAEPSHIVTFSGHSRTPLAPSVLDKVEVSIDITPGTHATNYLPRIRYRAGSSGGFDYVSMSNTSGNTYKGSIPGGAIGTMQYFVECLVPAAGRDSYASSYYPMDGSLSPLSYVNLDDAYLMSFENWTGTTLPKGFGVYTNTDADGWIANNAALPKNYNRTPLYCTWLDKYEANTNSWIRTPAMSNGVSGISFWARGSAVNGTNYFNIETSPNGVDSWSVVETLSYRGATYVNYYVSINTASKTYVRIIKTAGTIAAGLRLVIDDIGVYLPSASVQFSNIMTHPGYPSSNDTVDVSCFVDSVNPIAAAMDINAYLYYREDSEGSFNGPIEMVRNGNYYFTLDPIPAHVAGDIVQYYVKSTFSGYFRDARSDMSPSYYPTGIPDSGTNYYFDPPTNGFFSYEVRRYDSDYDHLEVTTSVGNVEMRLVNNNYWEGVLDVPEPTNYLSWTFLGINQYTNMANDYGSSPISWGDDYQVKFTLPMSNAGQPGGTNITATSATPFVNQILFRYDPSQDRYLVLRCVYQDFNDWHASGDYFEKSIDFADLLSTTDNFDSDAANAIYKTQYGNDAEDFELWPVTNVYYSDKTALAITQWLIEDAYVFEDFHTNLSCILKPTTNDGTVWPFLSNIASVNLDGMQKVTFDYRCVYDDNALSYYGPGSVWTNYSVQVDFRASEVGEGLPPSTWPYMSLFARYQNSSNYYELRLVKRRILPTLQDRISLYMYRCKNGVKTYLHGYNWGAVMKLSTQYQRLKLKVSDHNDGRVLVQGYLNGTPRTIYLETAANAISGVGTFACIPEQAGMQVDNVIVDETFGVAFRAGWSSGSYGTNTMGGWTLVNGQPYQTTWGYGRLYRHTTPYTNFGGYLTSPRIDLDIDVIRFNYHTYQAGASMQVLGSTNGTDWNLIENITGIPVNWTYDHEIRVGIGNYKYFKFLNTSVNDGNASLIIDEVFFSNENMYTEDFDGGTSVGWVDPEGVWSVPTDYYYRPGYVGPEIGYDIQFAHTNNSGPDEPAPGAWTTAVSRVVSNLVFVSDTHTFNNWDDQFIRIKHTTGSASLILDNINMYSWRAKPYSSGGWTGHDTWITEESPTDRRLELWTSRSDPAKPQYIMSPLLSNGVGAIYFDVKAINPPATFVIELATGVTNDFSTVVDTNTLTNSVWGQYGLTLNTAPVDTLIRVRNVSTNPSSIIYIDNMFVDDSIEQDANMWYAYNALITYSKDSRELEPNYQPPEEVKTCYLNNSPSANTRIGSTYTDDLAFVQSPYLSPGLGEISFWYRNWEDSGSPNAAIYVRASDDWESPASQWTNLFQIKTINDGEYHYFVTNYYITDLNYLRFYSSNSPAARVCLDNMMIAEPVGAGFDISNLKISPEQPLYTDSVGVSVDLSGFLLNPEIDATNSVRLYYYVGTNFWGNVNELAMNWLPMALTASNPSSMTFSSETPFLIPPKNIDDVVQFYVRCTYGGVFADKSSPKRHKLFTNPSWYYPRDLNVEHNEAQPETNITPYYFVYSCPVGSVWINEFNAIDDTSGTTYQFVELCGRESSIISNWHVQVLSTAFADLGDYTIISNSVLTDQTNGFGFWTIGDVAVPNIDMLLTNNIPDRGGIRLVRSMGAYEHALCFGYDAPSWNMTNSYPFQYVGIDDSWEDYTFRAIGTGSNATDFTWVNSPTYSPGGINNPPNQILIDWRAAAPFTGILITDFWITDTNVWMVFIGTNGLTPAPWYSTNVLSGTWTEILGSSFTESSGVYTQWFDIETNNTPYYYKIKAP